MNNWIWMPHAAHFICGNKCRFHLATCVSEKFIVSTVGEYWPDFRVRQILAESRGIKIDGIGDGWDNDYMQKIGYDEIGCDRKYETMVFAAKQSDNKCCPWVMVSGHNVDFAGYNDPGDAAKGHYEMCEKWSKL